MPNGNHISLRPADRAHYTAVKAALLGGFNFWAKRKANPELVERLADELAMQSVRTFRKRTQGAGK
jgi:hypothetical protein